MNDDMLRGAGDISEFLLGDASQRRRIYHLADRQQLPVFRMGSILCARKSTLITWIEQQERSASSAYRSSVDGK